MSKIQLSFCFIFSVLPLLVICGCVGRSENEVVVYAALDKEFSEPILEEFQKQTGITYVPKYDVESNKSVGLTTEIIRTAKKPRADVFWNNEILHTLRLQKLGLLDTYASPLGVHYPSQFRSDNGQWHGFAARARVLIVNTDLLPDPSQRPTSIYDLIDPKWKDNCGMAKPLFGTTATHATVLFTKWGDEKAKSFFSAVKENVTIESGNKQVALNVASGRYAWGITDTDDAIIEIDQGQPVVMVFPDQATDQEGTLLIPNTLCVIKNGPNSDNAARLVEFLLNAKVEDQLALGRSAQFPLSDQAKEKSRAQPEDLKVMEVDFEAASDQWENSTEFLFELFR